MLGLPYEGGGGVPDLSRSYSHTGLSHFAQNVADQNKIKQNCTKRCLLRQILRDLSVF